MLTRAQRCALMALDNALDHDPDHLIDVHDRLLARREPVSPRRPMDEPTPPGTPDLTGFGEGCVV